MIRELGPAGNQCIENELSGPRRKKAFGVASFGRGLAEGFGSVGYVFRTAQSAPRKKSLAMKLAQAAGSERKWVVTMAKRQIAAKYVGRAAATKLCPVSSEMQEGRGRRVDAFMMHRDFVTAVSKVHG